jgi:[ribosomal protein S18]-alanine N-acetyltransferase
MATRPGGSPLPKPSRPLPLDCIRPMSEEDLPEVEAIESGTFPDPWPYEGLAFELKQNPFCRCFVAEKDGAVVGYAFVWVVYEVAHLINIAVAADRRGQGFGEALLRHVLECARRGGAEAIHLEVRETNSGAIALYEKYGFVIRGRKERYYKDGTTAFLMEAPLGAPRDAS